MATSPNAPPTDVPTPTPVPPSPQAGPPPRRRRGLVARASGLLLLLVAVLLGLLGGVAWWLGTDSGLRFIVAQAESRLNTADTTLRIEDASGSLYRGIRIGRFAYAGGGLEAAGTDLVARYGLLDLLDRRVRVDELTAATIDLKLPPGEADPGPRAATPMPGSFALPVSVLLERFAIGRLTITPAPVAAPAPAPAPAPAATPPGTSAPAGDAAVSPTLAPIVIEQFGARFAYAAGLYRIDRLGVTTPWGRVDGGDASFGAEPPHALAASLAFVGEVERLAIRAKLVAEGDLERLVARVDGNLAGAGVKAEAGLRPLAVMPVENARVAVTGLDATRLAPALGEGTTLPKTAVDATVTLAATAGSPGDWTGTVLIDNPEAGDLASGKVPLRRLAAALQLLNIEDAEAREIRVRDLAISAPAAAASATATIRGEIDVTPGRSVDVAGFDIPRSRADLVFDAVDVQQFVAGLPPTALGGKVTLDARDFLVDLRQSAERMRALLPADLSAAAGEAEVFARGRFAADAVTLDEVRARLGAARLEASGRAATQSPRAVALKGSLRGVELAQWLPPGLAIEPRWREGRIGANWSVDGRLEPALDAMLTVDLVDSRLAGQALGAELRSHLQLKPDGSPARIDQTRVDLRLGRNQLKADGALGRAGDKLNVNAVVPDPASLDARLGGRLTIDGTLTGAFDRLLAQAAIRGDRLRFAAPDGEIRVASVRIDANGPVVADVPPNAALGAKVAVRGLALPAATIDSIDLGVDGSLNNHRYDLAVTGRRETLKLDGTGRATLGKTPQWVARLARLTVDGTVPVRLAGPADLRLTADSVRLERFKIAVADGTVDLARVLAGWAGAPTFDATGSLADLPVARLLALAGQQLEPEAMKPLAGLRLDGSWTLKGTGPEDLGGDARIALREVGSHPAEPAMRPATGSAAVPAAKPAGRLGLTGENGVQIRFDRGRMDGRLNLALPSLAFLRPFTGPDIELDGALGLTGTVAGTTTDPQWDLRLTGRDIGIVQRSVGWRLTGGELAARLVGRDVRIETLRLASGEGHVAVSGQARLFDDPKAAPAGSLPIDGRFDLTATRFHVPIGPGQRITLSGKTTLASGSNGTTLNGALRADNGLIEIQGSSAPALPDDVRVIDDRPGVKPVVAKPPPKGEVKPGAEPDKPSPIRIRTDLGIDLGDQLRLTGNGLAARLTGKLTLGGSLPDDPQMRGVVNVVDGAYRAYGQDLRIEKGIVRFNGPIDNPALDIEARRPFLPVQVGVAITGTALKPVIALVSNPDMSQTDKLAWLVLGTDPRNAPAAAQSLLLQQAAVNLLTDDDGSYQPGIAERLGLDVINFGYGSDIGPAQGVTESALPTGLPRRESSSSNSTPQEVVTLGKRFGNRVFVSYEQGVRSVWNLLRLQYTLTERLSARIQSGSDNALDLLYSWSFD